MLLTLRRTAVVAALVLAAAVVALAGCSRQLASTLLPNSPPELEVLETRADRTDPTAVRVRWAARDADGSVARTCWTLEPLRAHDGRPAVLSTRGEECLIPRGVSAATRAATGLRPEPERLTLWAVDDRGAESERTKITLWGTNIAPFVILTCPTPSPLISTTVAPTAGFTWTGIDPDGWFTQKPVKYRYRLVPDSDPLYTLGLLHPDSLRRYCEAQAWAGWDSTGGAQTSATIAGLTPGTQGLFIVIGFDELGDYNADWSRSDNMCQISVSYPGMLGPQIRVRGAGLDYTQQSGYWTTDPLATVSLEVPAGQPLAFSASAQPPIGYAIDGFRWALDATDPHDQTPRSGPDDLAHWSEWSIDGTIALPSLPAAGRKRLAHTLYIESTTTGCAGQPGERSLVTLRLVQVTPSFASDLLVVDDTRLQPDRFGANGIPQRYSGEWPAAAELDTFLYARGGFPWRGPNGITGNLPLSKPGVLAGYAFDTLGTRGAQSGPVPDPPYNQWPSATVPLSVLAQYRHVLWMTDVTGAISTNPLNSPINPMAALRYTNQRGIPSTLEQYAAMGGKVWLVGGTGAYCTLINFNAVGSRNNDNLYGAGKTIFSVAADELAPGRPMFDFAHWQSEMTTQAAVTTPTRFTPATGWSHPAWGGGTVSAPDYTRLPASLRRRALALGDSLPPTRTGQSNTFYTTNSVNVEYLDQPNIVFEDMNPDPIVVEERSGLDTLYRLQGGTLSTGSTLQTPVAMTWYHGPSAPPFVFSGFDIWAWSRQDVIALVDFVLQDVWGLARQPIARAPSAVPARIAHAAGRPGPPQAAAPLPRATLRTR